jgi:hypothetical protein
MISTLAGPSGGPLKADAILIVDADTMLALAIASQWLQSITWRRSELIQPNYGVELIKFSTRDPP